MSVFFFNFPPRLLLIGKQIAPPPNSHHWSSQCCCSLSSPVISLSLRRHDHGPLAKRLMHMVHLSGNTSGVSKSSSDWSNYTGFPGDMCVAFFNVLPENKDYLKYIREFHTLVCYCGDNSTPWNVMLNETNCDWMFDMSVKRSSLALANERGHIFQTFSC